MLPKRRLRLYLDTSVFGGCFDAEFSTDSSKVLGYIKEGAMHLVYSAILEAELREAPTHIRQLFLSLPITVRTRIDNLEETDLLAQTYLDAKILGPRWKDDCTHVAAATIARADAIVSWNFKHIVRLDKIKAYNSINFSKGYGILTIVSPKDINLYETD